MTTSETIIAILLLLSVIGLGVSIFLANLLNKELNQIINKLYTKLDDAQHNSMVLMKNIQDLEAEKAKRFEAQEKFKAEIIKNMKARVKPDINVLDFPNGD